ncbi:hypothetical protein HDF14_004075 [Edaphobacter lichenicola]|uniref:Uncharacterized protein n=1 Tax=Tunturiibacter gelidiferens TaxID=3069689 RepID=A0A9X0QHH3_9BACT|nr:hypothetical protein [Edaphobacter lichenicola]
MLLTLTIDSRGRDRRLDTSWLEERFGVPIRFLIHVFGRSLYANSSQLIGVTTPNVKNRTLSNFDHSFETANGRRGLNEPLRSFPAACQV